MAKFSPIAFIRSVIEENKKVIWPDRTTVTRHSTMVMVTILVATLTVAGVDYLFQKLVLLALGK